MGRSTKISSPVEVSLSPQSATTDVTRTITVAGGVFAPGHLGELTQVVPFELVDAVLEETGTVQQRLRDLPSRVGVYLLLAMGLFGQVGLGTVWSKLVAGLAGLPVAAPSEKALRDLRRRLGPAPVKALFGVLAGPLAQPHTPGVRYRRFRTVAFDGCSSLKAPDHERNRGWLGKIKHRLGFAGYPMLMLMALVETGTRGLLGAVFGPTAAGERAYAARLLHLLRPDMLLLDDRGFDSNDFLAAVVATGAQLLVRAKSSRRLPVVVVLPDGSYLTRIAGLSLRVIEAEVTVTGADGSRVTGVYRLLTTLTDYRTDPAATLIRLYHERWEIESAFFALRHTLLDGRVLRSKDPVGVEQEMWALLALYQALRIVMVDAAESVPGTDPDRAAFSVAVHAARDNVINAKGVVADTVDPIGQTGRAVLANLLPPRRSRFSARKVKSPISRYHAHTDTGRPLTSTTITAVDVIVLQPDQPTPQQTPANKTRRTRPAKHPSVPAAPKAPTRPPGRWPAVLTVLRSIPGRAWPARDIARTLGVTGETNLNSFCVQMSQWARRGLMTKTRPATYMIT
jgi:Insertion element 4 transposase N-terminal/Transposase DDE domain